MDELMAEYHKAIEARARAEDHIFIPDLMMVSELTHHYVNLRRFSKSYLGDYDKSSFAKIRQAASRTLVLIFEQDIIQVIPRWLFLVVYLTA